MTTVYKNKDILLATEQVLSYDEIQAVLSLYPESSIEQKFFSPAKYYYNNGFYLIPEQPSDDYVWNKESCCWVLSVERQTQSALFQRNRLLFESDWTQLTDVPQATKMAWVDYRQALRDITTKEGYPFNVIWPTKPK